MIYVIKTTEAIKLNPTSILSIVVSDRSDRDGIYGYHHNEDGNWTVYELVNLGWESDNGEPLETEDVIKALDIIASRPAPNDVTYVKVITRENQRLVKTLEDGHPVYESEYMEYAPVNQIMWLNDLDFALKQGYLTVPDLFFDDDHTFLYVTDPEKEFGEDEEDELDEEPEETEDDPVDTLLKETVEFCDEMKAETEKIKNEYQEHLDHIEEQAGGVEMDSFVLGALAGLAGVGLVAGIVKLVKGGK
jgi:hypothetical protein